MIKNKKNRKVFSYVCFFYVLVYDFTFRSVFSSQSALSETNKTTERENGCRTIFIKKQQHNRVKFSFREKSFSSERERGCEI